MEVSYSELSWSRVEGTAEGGGGGGDDAGPAMGGGGATVDWKLAVDEKEAV